MIRIRVEPAPGEDGYVLSESIIIEGVEIKKGFFWDGASIPRVLWPIIGSPFSPRFMAPSMVHDYLYSQGKKGARKTADRLFRKLLMANGVSKELTDAMYAGVRVGGKLHYG